MKIIEFEFPNVPKIDEPINLCLGYFDGIHLGHKKIFESAKKEGHKVAVLTFDNSPAFVLEKIQTNIYLTSTFDKADLLRNLGVDYLLIMHFDLKVAELTKDEFIENVIKILNPNKIYCGEDYRFGLRASGTPEYLRYEFSVEVVPTVTNENIKISSRDIINFIKEGNVENANKLLGRKYSVNGLVIEGKHNGGFLGFPTANIDLEYPYVMPKNGVYSGYVRINEKSYKAAIFVGNHPTISPLLKPIIECYIIDFSGNLYGKEVYVEFNSFIREEIHFINTDNLIKQIAQDIEIIKNTLH